MATTLQKIKELVWEASEIVIVSHYNPDGDAVGAVLGLASFLKRAGKSVRAISPSPPSERYAFLTGFDQIKTAATFSLPADLIIFLDCSNKERISPLTLPENFRGQIINIDHHEDNPLFGDVNLVLPLASSTGEIVYELCQTLGGHITPQEAAAFYVSVLTDTGNFHFKNTTPKTLRTAASMIEDGADPKLLTYLLFELTPFAQIKLLGLVLATLEKSASGEIAWVQVTGEMFKSTGTTAAAVEDFVNQVTRIAGLKIALLFREESPEVTKISIRTVEGLKANGIAARFGGGGHGLAAGCSIKTNIANSLPQMLKVCEEALAALERNN